MTTSDTAALASDFTKINVAATFDTNDGIAYDAPAISTTTVTFDQVGLAGDSLYLLVIGSAA